MHSNPQEHWNTHEAPQEPDHTAEARSIACDLELFDRGLQPTELRYTHIIEALQTRNLLEHEVKRVQEMYLPELEMFGMNLERDIWEMLTVLELFDPETARHCVDTYHIAKKKVETPLSTGITLANYFSEEGVSLQQFFVSCLLHDIGKIEVPHSVVVNRVSDEQCANLLLKHKDDILIPTLQKQLHNETYTLPENVYTPETLLAHLYNDLHTRPQMIAPVRLLLGTMSEEEKLETETQLRHCGCSLDDTLLKIMRTHDHYSREILMHAGREVEAILAGSHHHTGMEGSYVITIGTLRISIDLAHIIHLADVENAILSVRHYKENKTPLDALKILAVHAKHGLVDTYISYLWIADELHVQKLDTEHVTEQHRDDYNFICDFLDTQKSLHPEYPDWRLVTENT